MDFGVLIGDTKMVTENLGFSWGCSLPIEDTDEAFPVDDESLFLFPFI